MTECTHVLLRYFRTFRHLANSENVICSEIKSDPIKLLRAGQTQRVLCQLSTRSSISTEVLCCFSERWLHLSCKSKLFFPHNILVVHLFKTNVRGEIVHLACWRCEDFCIFEGGSDVCKQRCWSFSNQSVVWWSYRLMKASNVEKLNTNVRWNAHRMQYECSWAQLNRLWRLLLGSLFILFFCRWIKEKIFSVILYLYNFIFYCWEDVRQIICRFTISI